MIAQGRVLVVDDEQQIRRLLSVSLERQGYEVVAVPRGDAAIERLLDTSIDLVLLDLGLPDMDGLAVCRAIREWSQVPIIVVSVREHDREKIAALDSGADDYVTKPFSINELLARVRANLRRVSAEPDTPVVRFGHIEIDFARRRVTRDDQEIHLTPTEYDLLRVLSINAGKVVTHRQLLRETRGPAYEDDTPLLRVHMVALRQKLAAKPDGPAYIATEPGIGYRLLDG